MTEDTYRFNAPGAPDGKIIAVVAELFLGWAVGELLSGTLGLGRRTFTPSDQERILDYAVRRIQSELPPGAEARLLANAIRAQLSNERVADGSFQVALAEQLAPLSQGWFEIDGGKRETGARLMRRLGVTTETLVDRTETAFLEAVRTVAARRADLPTRVLLADLARVRERVGALTGPAPHVETSDTLVAAPSTMVGRQDELVRLIDLAGEVDRSVLAVVHGMGGVGKTALVRAFAHRVRDRFADGRFEVDLYGYTPGQQPRQPDHVLADLLRQVGFPASEIPASLAAKSERWRGWLSGRTVLLLLDNARSADQIVPLLPGIAAGCCTVVTSRNRLDELDAAHRLRLDTLPQADAIDLLRALSGRTEGLAEVALLCEGLALALRAVGPLLRAMSPADLVGVMRAAGRPFAHLADAERVLRSAFQVSYEELDDEHRRLLRWLAYHPGPDFDAGSAAAIWELQRPVATVRLDELSQRNLLLDTGNGRFAFHDLFLPYARELAEHHDETERAAVQERLFDNLLRRVQQAQVESRGTARSIDAREWLTDAAAELRTATMTAMRAQWLSAFELGYGVGEWLWRDGRLSSPDQLFTSMLEISTETGDRNGQAVALIGLSMLDRIRTDYARASERLRTAIELYESLDDTPGLAWATMRLANIARFRGDHVSAYEHYQRAERLYEAIGQPNSNPWVGWGLADVARMRRDHDQAIAGFRQALQTFEANDDLLSQADAWTGLGDVARDLGNYDEALRCYRRSERLIVQTGTRHAEALVGYRIGELAESHGHIDTAREAYQEALRIYDNMDNAVWVAACSEALERLARQD